MNNIDEDPAQPDREGARPDQQGGGEDENSSAKEGHDEHLHEDQKSVNPAPASSNTEHVSQDDPHKTEKLAKSGRDIDPNAGSD